MRSAALIAAMVLAGCKPAERAPAEPSATPDAAITTAAPAPTAASIPERNMQALGTEPFWAVEVTPGRLRYNTPENIKGTEFPAKRTIEGEAQIWTGTFEGGPFTLRIAPGRCSDGMSDTVYAYTAQVAFAAETRQGCARLR